MRPAGSSPDGFDSGDGVAVLGADIEPLLPRLLTAEGRWLLPDIVPLDSGNGGGGVVAVIDTGVRRDHPLLADAVIEELDLTGEGAEDFHGHGTAVAAILAATVPGTRIISIKALNRRAEGDVGTLALAFREAARLLAGRGRVVNVSAGRRTPSCTENCPLCATVTELQAAHPVTFVCAAGNQPGVTYCPARVGLAVATTDVWSAPGDVVDEAPRWHLPNS